MVGEQKSKRRVGVRRQLIVWKFGGTQERVALLLFATFGYVFVPLMAIWLFVKGVWDSSISFEFAVTLGLAASSVYSFLGVFLMALYNANNWRELLRLGYFHTKEGLAIEYLGYLETHGREGRLPGLARWVLAYWGIFYGLIATSSVFATLAFPLLGWLTPAAFLAVIAPIAYSCNLLFRKRMPVLFGRPDPSGFRLSEPLVPSWLVVS